MMEERITKIEKELALMAQTQKTISLSLDRISSTLEDISRYNTEIKLIELNYRNMESEIRENFNRVGDRINKLEEVNSKVVWRLIVPVILVVIGLVIKGIK